MSSLHIRLLGDFYLELDGEPLRTVNTSRLQAVLAYLLLHRQAPQSRQHMAFQFWPDSPEGQALNNLRKVLHMGGDPIDGDGRVWENSGKEDVWQNLTASRLIPPA